MNPYDILWSVGIVFCAVLAAYVLLGPFLSGLLLIVMIIVVTANLVTR
jgi:hypothetical protein